MRIAVVADSHLAPGARACNDNWRAVRDFVASARIDLTVHLGDITVDGVEDVGQFAHALAMSSKWPTPIRYLPGNHDIGDNPPGPEVAPKKPLVRARLEDFRAAFGADYWGFDADGWLVIGLNAQLAGTDTPDEADQWSWLAARLANRGRSRLMLMLHKPLFQVSPADEIPHQRYVPAAPRRRLRDLLSRADLRAVVSGHAHQYLDRMLDGVRHVWVPSTAFYLPDDMQDRVGEKITGLGVIDLTPESFAFHLVCPEGVMRNSALDHPLCLQLLGAHARPGAPARGQDEVAAR